MPSEWNVGNVVRFERYRYQLLALRLVGIWSERHLPYVCWWTRQMSLRGLHFPAEE